MFKYFILILVSLTCVASEPKFHFMDCVKIVNGFYKGCKGNVLGYTAADRDMPASYMVDVDDCNGQGFTHDFNENELRACKK